MTKTTRFGMRGLCGAVAAAVFLSLTHSALAWGQPQWVRQLGTSGYDPARGVATDGDGNVYIAGWLRGSDAFVAKYSRSGALRWKRQLGTAPEFDGAEGVATDGDANVYIAGDTSGSLGGPNQGSFDAWVAKYSPSGALRWERQLGSADGDIVSGVATDGDGNVYIAGYTEGSLGGPNQGSTDPWVAKYSAAGDLLWIKQFGTSDNESANAVTTDDDGNVYISGQTFQPDFEFDAWVVKYSPAGDLLWKQQFGTADDEIAYGAATDGNGNVYIAGSVSPSFGGVNDAWVAKYSAVGALLWQRQLGTADDDVALSVATDGEGSIYMCGYTFGSLGGPNRGDFDAWVAKYSAAGDLRWKKQLGTAEYDIAEGVATDRDANVYIAGDTSGSLGGPFRGGLLDAWVAKYSTRP